MLRNNTGELRGLRGYAVRPKVCMYCTTIAAGASFFVFKEKNGMMDQLRASWAALSDI